MLPVELLQPVLAEKVWPQFLRGDHDVAIFQAFKEIEVAVRTAANGKGAGYPDDLVGTTLMRKAFHPDSGPLTDVVTRYERAGGGDASLKMTFRPSRCFPISALPTTARI